MSGAATGPGGAAAGPGGAAAGPSGAGVWVEAARPRTLPAAVAPVLVGTAAAVRPVGELLWGRFALALLVALALQVAVNYANDYFDAVKGVDREDRLGPRRATAAGLVSPQAMKRAMLLALLVAALAGLALAALAGWELLLVGAAAILAALGYSGGRRPYASLGLGELFVFVFFGLVATGGSQYVQDERLVAYSLIAALPVGLLAVALLVVNNLRDIATDTLSGKRTLAVRIGEAATRRLFGRLVLAALGSAALLALIALSPWPLLPWLAAPMAIRAINIARRAPLGPRLIAALETTGRLQLVTGLLLAVGLVLAG